MTASRLGVLIAMAGLSAVVVAALLTGVPPAPGTAGVRLGIPLARVLVYLGAVVTVGVGLLSMVVDTAESRASAPVLRQARPVAVGGAAVWLVAALASILLPSWEISAASGRGFPSGGELLGYLDAFGAGKGLLASAVCAVISLLLAAFAMRTGNRVPAGVRVTVALVGLLPLPLTGHAAELPWSQLLTLAMEVHVVAAAAWAGGLGAIIAFLTRRPDLLAVALPRYSRIATWCVLAVGVTGVLTGTVELLQSLYGGLPQSLWRTDYGLLVLLKGAALAAIGVLAVRVRVVLLPRIAESRPTSIAVWCGAELTVMAIAFGLAAVLTRAAVTPL